MKFVRNSNLENTVKTAPDNSYDVHDVSSMSSEK